MNYHSPTGRSRSGPFGMGGQGYLIIAVVILTSALFAATRRDWASMLFSALVLPLIMFVIIDILSRLWPVGTSVRGGNTGTREDMDPLTFLARTNPIMFLLFAALNRGADDSRYGEYLRSGPYGMGQQGYLLALVVILAPLGLALIITAVTGGLPTHSGPQ